MAAANINNKKQRMMRYTERLFLMIGRGEGVVEDVRRQSNLEGDGVISDL